MFHTQGAWLGHSSCCVLMLPQVDAGCISVMQPTRCLCLCLCGSACVCDCLCVPWCLSCRNALQLNSQRDALRKHMEASSSFQRSQRDTTDKLLRGLQDLHKLLHSGGMGAAAPGSVAAAAAERAGSGVCSPRAGSSSGGGALGPKRFNSMAAAVSATGRMLGGKGGKGSRGTGAAMLAGTAAGVHSDEPLGVRVGGEPADSSQPLSPVESGDSDLVLSLQQQLEQQQKALQLQQELLQQVLARLPPLPEQQQQQ